MSFFEQFFGLILMAFVVYTGYVYLKNNPESLSKSALSNSLTTMGIIALILMLFVSVLVKMLGPGDLLKQHEVKKPVFSGAPQRVEEST